MLRQEKWFWSNSLIDTTNPESHTPLTTNLYLDFGSTPQSSEDSWFLIDSTGKSHRVTNYLRTFKGGSIESSHFDRRFTASDGTHCTWRYRKENQSDPGFTLVNDQQYLIAHYLEPSATCSFAESRKHRISAMLDNLAPERIPEGGMLMINDGWEHIADEILAGLTILRRLVQRSQK
ncbi:hypothetical protein FRC02_010956 [Tulasnella sp. 418]|nr:hypothetical protein FRC02_010956 [Tulasnella sp. 418]